MLDDAASRAVSGGIRLAGVARRRQHRRVAFADVRRALSHRRVARRNDVAESAFEPVAARDDRDDGLGRKSLFLLSGIARRVSA
jgi:hypothetical protein